MHPRTPRILALSIALAAGGAWFVAKASIERKQSDTQSPVNVQQANEDQALRREVALLRQEVAGLGRRPLPSPDEAEQAGRSPAQPSPEASDAPEATPPATDEERRQAVKEAHDTSVKTLEALVRKDPPDPRWTSQMEQEVAGVVPADSGSAMRSVECHTSLCRIELAHDDRPALERIKEDLPSNLHYPMTLLYEPDGSSFKSVLFIAREGGGVPDWRRGAAEGENHLD
jgi:hypothetical protein